MSIGGDACRRPPTATAASCPPEGKTLPLLPHPQPTVCLCRPPHCHYASPLLTSFELPRINTGVSHTESAGADSRVLLTLVAACSQAVVASRPLRLSTAAHP